MIVRNLVIVSIVLFVGRNISADEARSRLEFTRLIAHWAQYDSPDYLTFVEAAEPQIAQHGFYGAHFWSLAHTPHYAGYPAHFPVPGLEKCGQWFEKRNADLHNRKAKVIGHFNVEFLVGDPDGEHGPRGFFKFYRDLWDEALLGPKPVDDPVDFLEQGPGGKPIVNNNYRIGGMHEYWACLRNPHWQKVLRAWVKVGIERGLDGFIANYFYRHNCLCQHCQSGFRHYLDERFTNDELRKQFEIADLARHRFDELLFWHSPEETSPLRLEMLRWSQISNKRVFDEVFIDYGRSLKPDLIVAQWNHLGNFGQINSDERCLLPAEMWGRGEDYLWYSTGASAYYTDLENRYLGEGTLQARYIRGAFDDKPFTLGKYESTRIRVAISELAANGGAPMGFYTRFTAPDARREIVRYYQFLKQHAALFHGNRSHAEAALLFPRSAVHRGDVKPVKQFREIGTKLLDEHVLFDVVPDDLFNEDMRSRYQNVFAVDDPQLDRLKSMQRSRFDAPYTVRVSASRPVDSNDVVLHFVNYNRDEPPRGRNGKPSGGRGIADEKPIAVESVAVDFVLPKGAEVESVDALIPERDSSLPVDFEVDTGKASFEVPEFLVYCVVRIAIGD